MPVKKSDYEVLLAEYSNHQSAIALLKQHRPYMEMIPSMRRPEESVIAIPLPVVRLRNGETKATSSASGSLYPNAIAQGSEATCLPCDIAILMCDPEWKIKMGVEILVFIHRPQEDFSDLLMRWRHTQVLLEKDYEWLMPHRYQHILSEGSEKIYPLFVVFDETPDRIKRGLLGACLPLVIQTPVEIVEEEEQESLSMPEG